MTPVRFRLRTTSANGGSWVLIASFVLVIGLLKAVERTLLPSLQRDYSPPPAPVFGQRSGLEDLAMGTPAPEWLRSRTPGTFFVHIGCASCSVRPDSQLRLWLAEPNVTHLIAAPAQSEFEEILSDFPKAKVLFIDESKLNELRASFAPRAYRFDSESNLSYLQRQPSHSPKEAMGQ